MLVMAVALVLAVMLVLPCAGLTTATAAQVADYSQIVTGVNNVLAADLSSSAQVSQSRKDHMNVSQ